MGNKLVLLGGGGHCKSVLETSLKMGIYDDVVITDPLVSPGTSILGYTVVGTDDCLEELRQKGFEFAFITVGSVSINPAREELSDLVKRLGFKCPSIIDPSANISDTATIGEGTFIGRNAVVNADTRIGKHCIINTGAIIEHECIVGDFAHISVGSILCGEVTIGRNSFVGAGSTIIQCINIGDNAVVGANSTILTDVEQNMTCYGIVKKNGRV